jgi:cell division protein FtsQ
MKKPIVMPMDVRIMQWTSLAMFVLAFLLCVASSIGWLLRHPAFSIQGITVKGNVTHSNVVTLRANALTATVRQFFHAQFVASASSL